MDMIIVTGFLGSGKTSLILSTIGAVSAGNDGKVAIIVNDFGKIGIDAKVMDKYGLQVKELQGGCICCTLGSFLLDTVQKVAVNFHPDVLILEPTGIADPRSILNTMEKYSGPPMDRIIVIVVLDAPRYEIISKVMGPPFDHQLSAADVIVLNKVDETDDETIKGVIAHLREKGYEGEIILASAEAGTNLNRVVEVMTG